VYGIERAPARFSVVALGFSDESHGLGGGEVRERPLGIYLEILLRFAFMGNKILRGEGC
jgi:hypothetical protein